jgi:hypothetical protein
VFWPMRRFPLSWLAAYAVQENGYARFTSHLDIVVPDVVRSRECLLSNGFQEFPESIPCAAVTDTATTLQVHLISSGIITGVASLKVPVPGSEPAIADSRILLEMKLSGYLRGAVVRAKDLADVSKRPAYGSGRRPAGDRRRHTGHGNHSEVVPIATTC